MKPTVSIVCITFNQQKYIRQTLDSFLMQKTDFSIEVLIHDDASTDGTTEILKEYAAKHPRIIKPVYEAENQYSSGDYDFINDLFRSAKGKYIAFCEGDDFWTDELKLQKQVDFLEKHKEYTLCFHPVRVFFEKHEEPDSVFPDVNDSKVFTLEALLRRNFIQSNSVMYRRKSYKGIPSRIIPSDWYMHLYHAQDGKIGYINDVMSAYRRQSGGVWWETFKNVDLIWKKYGIQHLDLYVELLKLFGDKKKYADTLYDHIDTILVAFKNTDAKYNTRLLATALAKFPDTMSEAMKRVLTRYDDTKSRKDYLMSEVESLGRSLEQERQTVYHRDLELATIKDSKLWKLRNALKRRL
ncbi:MAG TPA: glycosyltransferase [Candidatus Saccharimonadales bacterium]|nr:glycosyltransferase [Candidatus Saccharimonadales bacterium]